MYRHAAFPLLQFPGVASFYKNTGHHGLSASSPDLTLSTSAKAPPPDTVMLRMRASVHLRAHIQSPAHPSSFILGLSTVLILLPEGDCLQMLQRYEFIPEQCVISSPGPGMQPPLGNFSLGARAWRLTPGIAYT